AACATPPAYAARPRCANRSPPVQRSLTEPPETVAAPRDGWLGRSLSIRWPGEHKAAAAVAFARRRRRRCQPGRSGEARRVATVRSMQSRNWLSLAPALFVLTATMPASADPLAQGASSVLPVPRFVSIKSERVNVRGGPDKDHEVVWVFTKAALPVEITAEFENWRRVRDWDGGEGWVYHSLLSGRRTVLVAPK